MDAIIISIGSELTVGQTVDTNASWLSARLAEIGVSVCAHITVPDELESIAYQTDRACELVDAVLITGGLGPTTDDLTRQALAKIMGVELELHEKSVERIKAFFFTRAQEMAENNIIQAKFPAGSEPIENTCGTAPGIRADYKRATIFAMPGVPREMKVMYERSVAPVLKKRSGGAVLLAKTIKCFGAGESDIAAKLGELMQRGKNPTVGTTAQQGVIGVRIHAHGSSRQEASALIEETAQKVRRRLGALIFGYDEDTLAHAVAELLTQQNKTVSTAESCTGGLIAKRLTDISGSSKFFLNGLVTYSNAAKQQLLNVPAKLIAEYGAVSPEVANIMADNCRSLCNSDYALSVTGIAGPTGGSAEKPVGLVYIGLADGQGCEVTEHRLGSHLCREEIRDRTCKSALNRLRLQLLSG